MKTEMGSWFHGEAAVTAGFVHRVDAPTTPAPRAAFKKEWLGMFTMLPAALFDTNELQMTAESTPTPDPAAAPVEPPAPVAAPVAPPVEPPAAPPAGENPPATDPVEPPAPENKAGLFERLSAALSGEMVPKAQFDSVSAELHTARQALADRDATLALRDDKIAALQPKADERDSLFAQVAELEKKKQTTGQAAAAIAAAHGLTPEKLAALPAPAGEASSILEQFDAIADAAERQKFYNEHKAELRAARLAK